MSDSKAKVLPINQKKIGNEILLKEATINMLKQIDVEVEKVAAKSKAEVDKFNAAFQMLNQQKITVLSTVLRERGVDESLKFQLTEDYKLIQIPSEVTPELVETN